jgi:hypothetical protein
MDWFVGRQTQERVNLAVEHLSDALGKPPGSAKRNRIGHADAGGQDHL